MSDSGSTGDGITLGMVLATVLSFFTNHSIGWAILHFFCGWFYVIYWALTYGMGKVY
jgi:hypothetical protein